MADTISPSNIATLSELLTLSGSQYRIYDIGRLVTKLPKEQFEKIELNQIAYPMPLQGHACFAIAFWQKITSQPFLWLLKLPLDERGLINQGARNHFIAIIVEALGADLTQETNKKQQQLLNSNPYLFTPAQYKLASLNSKVKVDLKRPPSQYFNDFLSYLTNITSQAKQWQHIGVQGITDFIALIHKNNHSKLLVDALPLLPPEVMSPVCSALENEQYSVTLIDTIIGLMTTPLSFTQENDVDLAKNLMLLRALAANSQHPHVIKKITQLLAYPQLDDQFLITLSGRCWQGLADEKPLMSFLEALLKHNNLALFGSVFSDLVSIPLIRPKALACIRSEHRSPALARAIGQLFQQ
jgi:hypothetical protein